MFAIVRCDEPPPPGPAEGPEAWQRLAGESPLPLAHPHAVHFAARDDDGAVIGGASVVLYPPPAGYDRMGVAGGVQADALGPPALAWIGSLALRATWRGRGVGRALAAACVEAAETAGAATIALDASEPGRKLFARVGFRDDGHAARWARGPGAPPLDLPEDDGGVSVHPTGPYEALDVAAYDAPLFGAGRGPVLADVLARAKGTALLAYARADGKLAGYVAADEHAIGPLVAKEARVAQVLLHACLAAGAPAVATLWDANAAAAEVFAEAGFRPTGATSARMVRGGDLPLRREAIFAVRSWAWG